MTFCVFRDKHQGDVRRITSYMYNNKYALRASFPGSMDDRLFDITEQVYIHPENGLNFPVKAGHIYQVCYPPEIVLKDETMHRDSISRSEFSVLRFRGRSKCFG
eukprot:GILK01015934.1.p1 GENE.GILK01015934.1~~GILK01015934.1.p1  ORF type:complete len:114 (+),score=4.16 GILK01015934.1:31-342(+)